MSRIEQIGVKLFGSSWQSQIANELKNEQGECIARQTVQSWHKRDTLPEWAVEQLIVVAKHRQSDIGEAIILLARSQKLQE